MSLLRRAVVPLVIVLLVVAGAIVFLNRNDDDKQLTAYFPQAISLYEGSKVEILGVPVGQVDHVSPQGTQVKVEMTYDSKVNLPADAKAVIVSPAIVGDRYVQLTPAYTGSGDTLASGTVLQQDRTGVPLELDSIFSDIDQLTVALGPDGANSKGALNDLLEVTARNFAGQGKKFHQTIENFSQLSQTLDDNKEALFGSARKLQGFVTKLADNDSTVRRFNGSLARVSTTLSGERQELARALRNLSVGLGQVGSFVRRNRDVLGSNIAGLNRVAKTLVHQRAALETTLRVAPLALNNLALAYNPQSGTLDTNSNVGQLFGDISSHPKDLLCALVSADDPNGQLCQAIQGLPLPRTGPFSKGGSARSTFGQAYDPSLGGLVGASGGAR